jgi:hypothetical protein
LVGGHGRIIAIEAGQPLANATLEITRPDGSSFEATTDANGDYALSLDFQGDYKVALVLAGVSVQTHTIAVGLPAAAILPPAVKPTITGQLVSYGWGLALILVIAVAFVVYLRLRPGGQSIKRRR